MKTTQARNVWLLLSVLAVIISILTSPWPTLHSWLLWIAGTGATYVVVVTAITTRLWSRLAWLFVAAATGLRVVTDIAASSSSGRPSSNSITAAEHILDVLSLILLICATLILAYRRQRVTSEVGSALDSAILLVASAMAATEYFLYPLWQNPSLTTLERSALTAIAILYLVLLATTARMWFASDGSLNRAVRILAAGLVTLIAGTVLTASDLLPTSTPSAFNLGVLQFASLLFFAAVGFAVLDPTAARPPAGDSEFGVASRGRVLLVLAVCGLIPLLLVLAGSGNFTTTGLFIAMTIVLVVLFGLRINMLISSYVDAVRREQTLREINAGLMRATNVTEIDDHLNDWTSRLVEQSDVTCLHGTVEELAALGVGAFGTRIRSESGGIRYRTIVTIADSNPSRRLAIDTPEVINSSAQNSLAVLGQSIGMAMERLALASRLIERGATQRLEVLLHHASDVIALVDDDGQIRYVTEAMRDLTNRSPTAALGLQWPGLFQDPAWARALLDRARDGVEVRGDLVMAKDTMFNSAVAGRRMSDSAEHPERRESQPDRRLEVDVVWLAADRQFVVTHHDITDRYLLEQQLAFQAFHDELTGLNNRVVFRAELLRAATRSQQSLESFAVMMLDLDDFKDINDSLGHPAGDEVLQVVAKRLIDCMREGDTPVRLGGDEFAVILESGHSVQDAMTVAARIIEALHKPISVNGNDVITGASIGIAISDGSADPADLERDADIALYEAKSGGKDQVVIFHSDMYDSAVRKMLMTNQIRVALERDEIAVRYQPVFELSTGNIAGIEALVRWDHPSQGELLPDEFISLAEETGGIVGIGRFVMRQALVDLASLLPNHPRHSELRLSINVSVRQLLSDDVAEYLAGVLRETGIAPDRVVIEVTESVLLPDEGAAVAQLQAIADLGISIYFDDFGTGWASLHQLRSLPIRGLKLAQEFVEGLPADFDAGVALTVLQLSNSINFEDPIAEGVESDTQNDFLIKLGYRLGQGYFVSQSLAIADLENLLTTTKSASWVGRLHSL